MPKVSAREVPPKAEHVPDRKALRTVSTILEGLRRLLPEPTPSPRLWAASPGATPAGCANIASGRQIDPQSRNFLLCWQEELSILVRQKIVFRHVSAAVGISHTGVEICTEEICQLPVSA